MAIKKAVVLPSGVELPEAYHKVIAINNIRNGTDNRVLYEVAVYKDSTARTANRGSVLQFTIPVTGDDTARFFGIDVLSVAGVNQVKQCYEHLKTQTARDIDYRVDTLDV